MFARAFLESVGGVGLVLMGEDAIEVVSAFAYSSASVPNEE